MHNVFAALFTAMGMLFRLCVLPNSSACGINNINVVSILSNLMYKYVSDDMYLKASTTRSAAGAGASAGEVSGEVDMRGRKVQKHVQTTKKPAQARGGDSDGSSDDDEEEKEDDDAGMGAGTGSGTGEGGGMNVDNEVEGDVGRRSARATRKVVNYAESNLVDAAAGKTKSSKRRSAMALNDAVLTPYCSRLISMLELFVPNTDVDSILLEEEGPSDRNHNSAHRNLYIELYTLRTSSLESSLDVILDTLLLLSTINVGGTTAGGVPKIIKSKCSTDSI